MRIARAWFPMHSAPQATALIVANPALAVHFGETPAWMYPRNHIAFHIFHVLRWQVLS